MNGNPWVRPYVLTGGRIRTRHRLYVLTDRPSPDEHLRRLRAMLLEHFPWEGELYRNAEPTDARASLVGAFPMTVPASDQQLVHRGWARAAPAGGHPLSVAEFSPAA
jgi:hypothetical protein